MNDGAISHVAAGAALRPQRDQLLLEASQFPQALIDMADVLFQKAIDRTAIGRRPVHGAEKFPNLLLRHVQGTAIANEAQPFQMLWTVEAVVSHRSSGLGKETHPFIIAYCFNGALCSFGEVSDFHAQRVLTLKRVQGVSSIIALSL